MNKTKNYKQVAERDNSLCRVCGKPSSDIHHIVYRSHGGTNDIRNLIALCRGCHDNAHKDEKVMREYLMGLQREIYGRFDVDDVKKKNKWERS